MSRLHVLKRDGSLGAHQAAESNKRAIRQLFTHAEGSQDARLKRWQERLPGSAGVSPAHGKPWRVGVSPAHRKPGSAGVSPAHGKPWDTMLAGRRDGGARRKSRGCPTGCPTGCPAGGAQTEQRRPDDFISRQTHAGRFCRGESFVSRLEQMLQRRLRPLPRGTKPKREMAESEADAWSVPDIVDIVPDTHRMPSRQDQSSSAGGRQLRGGGSKHRVAARRQTLPDGVYLR